MDTKWQRVANSLWQAVLSKSQELKAQGSTLQELANLVGVSSRAVVGAWLTGSRKASGSSFAELMTYAERLGIDYRAYFPGGEPPVQVPAPSCATCKKLLAKDREIQKLQQQMDKMRLELAGAQGEIRALERQLDRREVGQTAGRQAGRDACGAQSSRVDGRGSARIIPFEEAKRLRPRGGRHE